MVGVCGAGMSGLAVLLKAKGFHVTGCDSCPGRMASWLRERGIAVLDGHDSEHVAADVEAVIRSPAVPDENGEIRHARERGLPVLPRGAVLPGLLRDRESVAVAGTHGKTTTSSFISQALRNVGRDPSWCVGGDTEILGGVAGIGHEADGLIVVEADESDGTLELYAPRIAVITNVDFDHMEHFGDLYAFEACFRTFVENAGQVVFCRDDERATTLCDGMNGAVSFGLSVDADFRAVDVRDTGSSVSFTIENGGTAIGRVELPVGGIHNARNALAAATVLRTLGVGPEEACRGLAGLGMPRRRFEKIVEKNGVLVVSDYAHHPAEISALVKTAASIEHGRLLAVFQPHRYTRTLALGAEFPGAFEGVDKLVLTPVYSAAEKSLPGGTAEDLYEHFRGTTAGAGDVILAGSLEEAWELVSADLGAGDILLIVGAGDVEKIAEWAKRDIIGPAIEE